MRDDEYPRPDPDKLLELVTEEERRQARGKLRVFLGACPGVGKTYAMLDAARLKRSEGLDVVVGLVETHGREETDALLYGMEIIERRKVEYKGHTLTEFDLDGSIARRPGLILIDELAHENAPGSRHAKRWQDVEEVLEAGIDVFTTLNVQHLESLNDVVAQITGVNIHETVPDAVLERAEAVVLVDLPPEDLRQRLAEGKVYMPAQANWAAKNFFREGNLIALRELALRTTAQRVNTEVLIFRQGRAIETTWPTSERIMVCVGPSPSSAKLIRSAKRLASGLSAAWLAVSIESPRDASVTGTQHERIMRNLELAKELGPRPTCSPASRWPGPSSISPGSKTFPRSSSASRFAASGCATTSYPVRWTRSSASPARSTSTSSGATTPPPESPSRRSPWPNPWPGARSPRAWP